MRLNWKPVIASLFEALEKAGFELDRVDDGEGTERRREHMLEAANACDECWLYVKPPGESRRYAIYIVLGNEPFETVADYACHPLLDTVLEAWSDSWEGKPCPTE